MTAEEPATKRARFSEDGVQADRSGMGSARQEVPIAGVVAGANDHKAAVAAAISTTAARPVPGRGWHLPQYNLIVQQTMRRR
eukprot:SAG31_NODE_32003_length_361_cov_0.786260_1_plen_82_part_00